jgi:membrane protein YdbS with pleckstrin-like domain
MVDASAVVVASVVVALAVGAGVSAVAVAIFGASSAVAKIATAIFRASSAVLDRQRRHHHWRWRRGDVVVPLALIVGFDGVCELNFLVN